MTDFHQFCVTGFQMLMFTGSEEMSQPCQRGSEEEREGCQSLSTL